MTNKRKRAHTMATEERQKGPRQKIGSTQIARDALPQSVRFIPSSRPRMTRNSIHSVLGEDLQRHLFMAHAAEQLKREMTTTTTERSTGITNNSDSNNCLIKRIYKHIQAAYALGYDCRGYCENTLHSMSNLLRKLDSLPDQTPNSDSMTCSLSLASPDASFVDIGSGFGKVVFHARLSHPHLKACVGIEIDEGRHLVASDTLSLFSPYISECLSPERPDPGIQFILGDAREQQQLDFTHVFMFDYVFPENVYDKLLPVLERSSFRILVTWRRLGFLQNHGLHSIELLDKLSLTTTGKQQLTCYIYRKTNINSTTVEQ